MSKTSRFANLMGNILGKKADGTEEDMAAKPTQNEGESDDDFKERLKKWEDDQDDGEEAAAAEGPKDTTDNSPEQPDDKAKKALKEATDKARAEGHAAGFKAGGDRWATVLASKEAVGRAITACSLLGDTDMSAANIQKSLAALPAETGRSTLAARHPTPTPAVSPDSAQATDKKTPGSFGARVAAARDKVNGKTAA